MRYTLYISANCTYCLKIINYFKDKKIGCQIVDLDNNSSTPKSIYAVPALFLNDDLMAYGADIISYLERNT